MSINKNDCFDCANCVNDNLIKHDWTCTKGHIISKDENGIVVVLDDDCDDFDYPE
jgi:regulator of RNase E activity RraA